MKKPLKYEFSMSGFMIAIIIVAMCSTIFALFLVEAQEQYGFGGTVDFAGYNDTSLLIQNLEDINEKTNIEQQEGLLDVIGGYFSSGYSILKVALGSFSLFDGLIDNAAEDVPYLAVFKAFLYAIIMVGMFIGIALAVLVKLRV